MVHNFFRGRDWQGHPLVELWLNYGLLRMLAIISGGSLRGGPGVLSWKYMPFWIVELVMSLKSVSLNRDGCEGHIGLRFME